MSYLPALPPISDPAVFDAVSSLRHAAESYSNAFLLLLASAERSPEIEAFMQRQGQHLIQCHHVIRHWSEQLDLMEASDHQHGQGSG
ncbi:MAG: hypothetical protein AAGA72_09245 [Pseudomonadota bacterium]